MFFVALQRKRSRWKGRGRAHDAMRCDAMRNRSRRNTAAKVSSSEPNLDSAGWLIFPWAEDTRQIISESLYYSDKAIQRESAQPPAEILARPSSPKGNDEKTQEPSQENSQFYYSPLLQIATRLQISQMCRARSDPGYITLLIKYCQSNFRTNRLNDDQQPATTRRLIFIEPSAAKCGSRHVRPAISCLSLQRYSQGGHELCCKHSNKYGHENFDEKSGVTRYPLIFHQISLDTHTYS